MIIVFFHVLYLIGKMVYENYNSVKRKDSEDRVGESVEPVEFSNKRHAVDPFLSYDDHYDDDATNAPRFSPPAYVQRYLAVQKVLADPRYQGKIKKVVDFGCSELGFLIHLKNTAFIEEIICVDVDRETLQFHKNKAMPLNVDYLRTRANPLSIGVYEGSVTHRDKKLADCDAVVAIELIEHLYPETLQDLPHNIFGYVRPLVVVVTTPNADFNVLFGFTGDKMRHWDHKFEWTRQQFEDWANNIISRYPEYEVSFQGIAAGPAGTEHLGCCSQMAVFNRVREFPNISIHGTEDLLKLVIHQEYPYRVDNRSDEQKILDEAAYYIRLYIHNDPDCENGYPLASLLKHLENFFITAETLREILENGGYAIVDNANVATIVCPALSTFSDYDDEITNENNDVDWDNADDRDNSSYDENFGNWTENNIEPAYAENWDDDYEIPAPNFRRNDETSNDNETEDDTAMDLELSATRSFDTADFNGIDISNVSSHVQSIREFIQPNGLSQFLESFESVEDDGRRDPDVSSNATKNLLSEQNASVERETEAVINISSSEIKKRYSSEDSKTEIDDSPELVSLCSIYLESSRNDETGVCPENTTNPNFDCASLVDSFEESRNFEKFVSPEKSLNRSTSKLKNPEKTTTRAVLNGDDVSGPQFASSPRGLVDRGAFGDAKKSGARENHVDDSKNHSRTSLRSSGNVSTATTASTDSSSDALRKWFPREDDFMYKNVDCAKLKGGNDMSDDITREIPSGSREPDCSSETIVNAPEKIVGCRISRQRAPESLQLRITTSSKDFQQSSSLLHAVTSNPCSKSASTTSTLPNDVASAKSSSEATSIAQPIDENLGASTHKSNSDEIGEHNRSGIVATSDRLAAKPGSPEAPETPPNSWSPEIMDSGYPNSSSTQDLTPEYDLSSIAQDRISDSESPSVAEAPRLGFPDHANVENGDLANNNRDDEGNNMIPEDENDLDEDLQPLIDVLENDLENENDIYAVENGFPVWLLRILERGNAAGRRAVGRGLAAGEDRPAIDVNAGGDAGMPDLDEGFDGTSSEDDNGDDVSTESSEETFDWNASGDYH